MNFCVCFGVVTDIKTDNTMLNRYYAGWTYTKYYMYLINTSTLAGGNTWSIFKWNLTGLNSVFSFLTVCHIKNTEPNLLYYYSKEKKEKMDAYHLCKMQITSCRIWFSYDDNHYTTSDPTPFIYLQISLIIIMVYLIFITIKKIGFDK